MTPIRRLLLVGFMGAGKSSVGPRIAAALGWRFVDADEAVVERLGESVSVIFEERGEAFFREHEDDVMSELLAEDRVVIAAGGGWAAKPEWGDRLGVGTASVWLRVTAETAVARAATTPGSRPLLDTADPARTARELVLERSASYALAHYEVDTERHSVEDVSALILEIVGKNDLLMDAE